MGIFMKQAPLPESNKPAEKKWIDRGMLMTILALAWPTMLEQFMQTAVQYIDTAMVGSLGTRAMAAVGSTGTVNWLRSEERRVGKECM